MFGAGGTGKSTLGTFIEGGLDTDTDVGEYKETLRTVAHKASGTEPATLHVVPGQKSKQQTYWSEQYREIAKGDVTRVINVGCWGYHATGLERDRIEGFDPQQTAEEFSELYLERSRMLELEALANVIPHLVTAPGPIRLMTLVSKQDLWWHRRKEVQAFYQGGEYSELLKPIIDAKGADRFEHTITSAALVQQNLRTADGFELAQTVAGYDDPLRLANLASFSHIIEDFLR